MEKIGVPNCPKTKGYVVTIVENKAIDLYRRRKRRQALELDDDACGIQVVYEGENTLTACILKLPARYREAILLRYVQGYSVKEMASILGLSFAAASKLDQRAKARLKDLYEKEGKL
ncbi:RNA polymerase sigma factor [Pseudoflavonifractor phocaeensis]|uniref:RNA polymerase sigma factor n=1 Tax=Pseudoflavonifractor phocaeensis TaxID=1870988 RepID=UPI0019561FC4|nr:sigma-70 family RNA polymerase sigma factor [Pseudoflavonifractor phocaeensis]MBM6722657.1 sigma-70 family RNA polymerase sigma factor [Pseudoflavonifractor phocaeensis]